MTPQIQFLASAYPQLAQGNQMRNRSACSQFNSKVNFTSKPLLLSKPCQELATKTRTLFLEAHSLIAKPLEINGLKIEAKQISVPKLSSVAKDGTGVRVSEVNEQDAFYMELKNEAKSIKESFKVFCGNQGYYSQKGTFTATANGDLVNNRAERSKIEALILKYLPEIANKTISK